MFWREVLSHAQASPVIILTNDSKADWIHPVARIENYEGKSLGRTPQAAVDAQVPHPYLTFEAEDRGIQQLEVLNVGNLALFLEMEKPESARVLVSAAYPRGIEDDSIPNWESLGIRRPAAASAMSLEDVTLPSIRLSSSKPPLFLRRVLHSLRGTREEVQVLDLRKEFPELLPTLGSVETAVLGKSFFRALAMFPGINTFSEILEIAREAYAPAQPALYLGMLLGIYLSNSNEVRRIPGGDLASGLFELSGGDFAASALAQLTTILEAEDVWLLASPTAGPGSVEVSFDFENDFEVVQTVSGIAVGTNEVFDISAADSRKLQTFFPAGQCSVQELIRLMAREFTIPFAALATSFDQSKQLTWQEGMGIGTLRTDLRKIVTDLEALLEDANHE